MHIELAPVDEKYIKESVKNGYYRSEAEAVRDAVRRARELEEAKHSRLLAALEVGEKDIREGRTVLYTPDLIKESTARARKMVADGQAPNPDVLP
jgi:putative addiction module CopG family antidote